MNVYWIDLRVPATEQLSMHGFGVTAKDQADALQLLGEALKNLGYSIEIDKLKPSFRTINDISEIEENHVRPNMGMHLRRGVWFPAS
jgi:hypothetical protein